MPRIAQTGFSRVFSIAYGASPNNQPIYQGFWKAGAVSWKQGDVKPIRYPSPAQYDQFIQLGKIRGEQGYPELKIAARYSHDLSALLAMTRQDCDVDLQVHFGVCGDPRDANGGWDKILCLEHASITDYATDNLGALDSGERAMVMENVPFTGEDYYEIMRVIASRTDSVGVVNEVMDIKVVDSVTCGLCGVTSDGCTIVMALCAATGGSPGRPAEVQVSQDGGLTWTTHYITTLAANLNPSAFASCGTNMVVISNGDDALHYAKTADILTNTESWTKVSTGFNVSGGPNAIFSLGPTLTWIVGDAGYIYFTNDPTSSVSIQDAGIATTQSLKAIHGWDANNLLAVGASNAVVFTKNGGQTWASVTGPNPAVQLNACFMLSETTWFVGDAAGKLWYTTNSGLTWTRKVFPKDGTGNVRDIQFSTRTVGWMVADDGTATGGRVFRTIDGGNSWYIAPEGSVTLPSNNKIDKIATCASANIVYLGGLATVGGSGIITKVEPALASVASGTSF